MAVLGQGRHSDHVRYTSADTPIADKAANPAEFSVGPCSGSPRAHFSIRRPEFGGKQGKRRPRPTSLAQPISLLTPRQMLQPHNRIDPS